MATAIGFKSLCQLMLALPDPRRGLTSAAHCGSRLGPAALVAQQESSNPPDRGAEHRDICCEGKAAGVRLHSDFDQSCKVLLAFSWDHRRHESANFVNINFRGSR
jgi:hypothetical protein